MKTEEIYSKITEKIIEDLKGGLIPWQKPWGTRPAINRSTGRPYSIVNQFLLLKQDSEVESNEWATFAQWKKLGGHIRKGEKASFIVTWTTHPTKMKDENGNPVLDENGNQKYYSYLMPRLYSVFEIHQVDGVDPLPKVEATSKFAPDEMSEKILTNYWEAENIVVKRGGLSAESFYVPALDTIRLPKIEQFISADEYYSTAFHESVHSTGAANRLNRKVSNKFGNDDYSKEELVAEIGAAYLCNISGIATDRSNKNSSAYIQGWVNVLQNDNKFIISAAAQAEKAVKYILQYTDVDSPDPDGPKDDKKEHVKDDPEDVKDIKDVAGVVTPVTSTDLIDKYVNLKSMYQEIDSSKGYNVAYVSKKIDVKYMTSKGRNEKEIAVYPYAFRDKLCSLDTFKDLMKIVETIPDDDVFVKIAGSIRKCFNISVDQVKKGKRNADDLKSLDIFALLLKKVEEDRLENGPVVPESEYSDDDWFGFGCADPDPDNVPDWIKDDKPNFARPCERHNQFFTR